MCRILNDKYIKMINNTLFTHFTLILIPQSLRFVVPMRNISDNATWRDTSYIIILVTPPSGYINIHDNIKRIACASCKQLFVSLEKILDLDINQ